MPERFVELYYSIAEVCMLLRFSDTTVRRWIRDGRFSPGGDLSNVMQVGDDIRVPASGVNFFISNNPFRYDVGVKARNRGELARKLKGKGSDVGTRPPAAFFSRHTAVSDAEGVNGDGSGLLDEVLSGGKGA